jgi:fermentation-respiration switch protein FrsA (DUF1100 family)
MDGNVSSSLSAVSELVFYVIIIAVVALIIPSFAIYPGLYYGRWKTKGPTFQLETKDKTKIEGMFIEPDDPENAKVTFLFFHGNSGNMGGRSKFMLDLKNSFNAYVVSIDYRGFGGSYGFPSESGIINDAESILERISNDDRLKGTKKIVYGQSLGGAVAVALATLPMIKKQIDGIILENTFTCISDAAKNTMFKKIPGVLIDVLTYTNSWDSLTKIKGLRKGVGVLFLSGKQDRVVSPLQMEQLYNACKIKNKIMYEVEDGDHNDTYFKGGEKVREKIKEFITSL